MKTIIQSVTGRRLWDSRGRPTVEAEVTIEGIDDEVEAEPPAEDSPRGEATGSA